MSQQSVFHFPLEEEKYLPWSITKMQALSCGRYARHLWEQGAEENAKLDTGASYLIEGIAMHEAIESWIASHAFKKPLVELGAILSKWNILLDEWVTCFDQYEKAKRFFTFDETTGFPLFSGGDVYGLECVLGVDKDWNPIQSGESVPFCKGTIDMIQVQGNVVTLTDHKRQWNILSETDIEQKLQMQLYASLAFAHFPKAHKVVFVMYFIRYGTSKEVSFFREDVANIPAVVRAIAQKNINNLKSQRDKPTPGEMCSFCSISSNCPAGSIAEEDIQIIQNALQAKVLAQKLQLTKRWVSDASDRLKAWTMHNGPVSLDNGKNIGFVPAKDPQWETTNKEMLFSVVDEWNRSGLLDKVKFSPDDLLSVDGKGLRKLVVALTQYSKDTGDKNPQAMIQSICHPKQKTTFREHKDD